MSKPKSASTGSPFGHGKGKLDDMLTKLMKKNNCVSFTVSFRFLSSIPLHGTHCNTRLFFPKQPVEDTSNSGGKEKRRRKLDEIVMGLSAAKEQKTFSDPLLPSSSKKQQIPPSVSVTPANQQPSGSGSQQQSNQKPFTITVTSVPGRKKGSIHALLILSS